MMFKKIVFVGSALALIIAAGLWLMPKDSKANPPCGTCGTWEVINNVPTSPCGTHELELVFPHPCPNELVDVTAGASGQVPCGSGDCGNYCALGINVPGHGTVNFGTGNGCWTVPSACCPSGTYQLCINSDPSTGHTIVTMDCI